MLYEVITSTALADGRFFTGGYTGAVHCYNLTTGELLWRYEDYTGRTVFPYFTLMLGPVADGKIYVGTHEHSADTPLFVITSYSIHYTKLYDPGRGRNSAPPEPAAHHLLP